MRDSLSAAATLFAENLFRGILKDVSVAVPGVGIAVQLLRKVQEEHVRVTKGAWRPARCIRPDPWRPPGMPCGCNGCDPTDAAVCAAQFANDLYLLQAKAKARPVVAIASDDHVFDTSHTEESPLRFATDFLAGVAAAPADSHAVAEVHKRVAKLRGTAERWLHDLMVKMR